MKVLDIISEAPQPGTAPPGMKWNGSIFVPISAPDKSPKNKSNKNSKKPIQFSGKRTAPPPEFKRTSKTAKPDWWDRTVERWKKRSSNYDAYVSQRVPKFIDKLGGILGRILKYAGLLTPVYTLYNDLAKLEFDYINEIYPYDSGDDDQDIATYNVSRNYMWGKFMATEGAVIAAQSIKWMLKTVFWTRLAKNLVTFLSSGVTLGASIAVGLATEAGILWFSNWLQSPEGEKWWTNAVVEGYLKGAGNWADGAWSLLVGSYNAATQGKFITPADQAREKRAAGKPPQSDQSKQLPTEPPESQNKIKWPKEIRNWVNGGWSVGGHPVTDGRGYLRPESAGVLSVEGARASAKLRGLPDPLADLPVAPGEKHPGPFKG